MSDTTPSSFTTPTRLHVAIAVTDVDRALGFYRTLFGVEPTKVRDDYAKFEVEDPPVNFTLNQTAGAKPPSTPYHYGIQVKTVEAVEVLRTRLEADGHGVEVEQNVTCCYAVSDKIWAVDPDGHRWEVFVTHADAPVHSIPKVVEANAETQSPCCAPECCT